MAKESAGDSAALLRRIEQGDQSAWEALYLRYRDSLLFAIRARLGPELRTRLESEDVLHSVMRGVIGDLATFEPRGDAALGRYLHVCALNKIRSKAAFFAAEKRADDVPLSDSLLARLPAKGAAEYLDSDRWIALERALGRLTAELRELVLLRTVEGLANAEAAERIGKSPDAASKMFNRAIAKLGIALGT